MPLLTHRQELGNGKHLQSRKDIPVVRAAELGLKPEPLDSESDSDDFEAELPARPAAISKAVKATKTTRQTRGSTASSTVDADSDVDMLAGDEDELDEQPSHPVKAKQGGRKTVAASSKGKLSSPKKVVHPSNKGGKAKVSPKESEYSRLGNLKLRKVATQMPAYLSGWFDKVRLRTIWDLSHFGLTSDSILAALVPMWVEHVMVGLAQGTIKPQKDRVPQGYGTFLRALLAIKKQLRDFEDEDEAEERAKMEAEEEESEE